MLFSGQREKPGEAATFSNIAPSTLIPHSGKTLEPPMSLPTQLMEARDGSANAQIIEATSKKWACCGLGSSSRWKAQQPAPMPFACRGCLSLPIPIF